MHQHKLSINLAWVHVCMKHSAAVHASHAGCELVSPMLHQVAPAKPGPTHRLCNTEGPHWHCIVPRHRSVPHPCVKRRLPSGHEGFSTDLCTAVHALADETLIKPAAAWHAY